VASRPLAKTEAANERRAADTAKAAEVAQRFRGWHVVSSRDGSTRIATRTGDHENPLDGVWAATLMGDDWADLELQLAEQAQHDAEQTAA
jgi:hypothetical protein